ncbi:ergothioneine biosynthesis protein EgtC [Desulforhopalus sp. 52FAK]
MCRFAAYLGPEIFLSSLVTEPVHSIIHQSFQAKERVEPLNGDGFGVGWYASQFSDSPALFKEVSPAWNSANLRNIARVTKSDCIFAHVRAATVGGQVSRSNCHPFSWNSYLFMHNGTVFGFDKIRRDLRRELSDESYAMIKGNTDSEHLLAMFVDEIREIAEPTVEQLSFALTKVIERIEHLKANAGVTTPSTLNLVLSDGRRMVATRYVSSGEDSNSLYLLQGDEFHCRKGQFSMDPGDNAVLLVSEPLNSSKEWQKVRNNHMIVVDSDRSPIQKPIEIGTD